MGSKVKMAAKSAKYFLGRNSSSILTGASIAGLVATTVMAVKATPKAMQILEDDKIVDEKQGLCRHYEHNLLEKAKLTWKCYIPTAIVGGLTISSMVWSNSINLKRAAALASAYSLSESRFRSYREKIIDRIGESKIKEIDSAVAKEKLDKDPLGSKEVILTGKGETLCYDAFSGRYFKSSVEEIKRILNRLSREMLSEDFVVLNDIYFELGLSRTKLGDNLGWHVSDGLVEPSFSAQLLEDGSPCIVLDFYTEPKYLEF